MKNKIKQLSGSWYFFIVIVLSYLVLLLIKRDSFFSALKFSINIIIRVLPVFILIYILMAISDYFITPEFIIRHLKEKKLRKWFFVIIGGILSSGPIYMWYPLLANLKEKGLSYGLIACFLYNRAIKIPLMPIMALYFSWSYIIILAVVMIFVSIIQGILIDRIIKQ